MQFYTTLSQEDMQTQLSLYNTFVHTNATLHKTGADPGFGVRGDEIRQGDLRVLLLLSHMFMERMMQEN